jgi:hypothetical protein
MTNKHFQMFLAKNIPQSKGNIPPGKVVLVILHKAAALEMITLWCSFYFGLISLFSLENLNHKNSRDQFVSTEYTFKLTAQKALFL